jgi:gas vesicle protein
MGHRHSHSVIDHPTELFGVAAIAAIIGATTAILFAPKSGSQTRQGIRSRTVDLAKRMKNPKEVKDDTIEPTVDRLTETIHAVRGRAKETIQKIHDDAQLTKEELKDSLRQPKSDSPDEVDHIRKHGEL